MLAYVDIRPHQTWILWFVAALVALSTDGLVRSHPRWTGDGPFASTVYMFLPALAVLGAGFFIDEAIDGYARPVAALIAAASTVLVAQGEYHTADFGSRM